MNIWKWVAVSLLVYTAGEHKKETLGAVEGFLGVVTMPLQWSR
jgi:hypothetical protein